jgi:protein-S-isoprenylcysteine O-methyltransferase Ste14
MLIPYYIIGICWTIFIVVWIVSAMGSKRTVRNASWWKGALVRVGIFIVVVWLINDSGSSSGFFARSAESFSNPVLNWIGVILCIIGIAFALWARAYLGRNWGMPMSIKENRELVTAGPYRFVRHPIYTGMIVAILGSALVGGLPWLVFFVAYMIYFLYSATREEKMLAEEFPDTYPAYKKRTKMVIPFVL